MRFTILAIGALFWAQTPPPVRTASIEGVVVSVGSGLPVSGVQVKLITVSGPPRSGPDETTVLTESDGKFAFRNVIPDATYRLSFARNTDDRGEYRLYWVTPGRYYITAEPRSAHGNPVSANTLQSDPYVGTYYPGTIDSSKATLIDVGAGIDIVGIDWPLYSTRGEPRSHHVRGRVIDSRTGQSPRTNVSISVSRRVGGGEVTGVALSGRVRTDSSPLSKENTERVRAGLTWVGARLPFAENAADPATQWVEPDGTFTQYRLPPGPYRVSVSPLPSDYYIKTATLGQTDVLGQTVQITGFVAGPLDVVISDKSGLIDGIVLDARRQPVANIEAVLIPESQRDRTDLYKRGLTDGNGRFAIRGIPPGIYRLFAWENIEPYGYFDPQVVLQAEPSGRLVRVGELSKETVEIRSIP